MTIAAAAIITRGLTGGLTGACTGGALLLAGPFTLYCVTDIIQPTVAGAAGGRPMQPGEISRLYQPVPEEWQYIQVPRDKEAEYFRQKKNVVIEFKLGKFQSTKEYQVPEERAKVIFNIVNMTNTTLARIQVQATKLKRLYTKAVVKLNSFRVK